MVIGELLDYAKALREDDRKILEELLKLPLKKVGAISYACSLDVWAFLILSIMIEQEKRIRHYESMAHGRIQERELDNLVGEDRR